MGIFSRILDKLRHGPGSTPKPVHSPQRVRDSNKLSPLRKPVSRGRLADRYKTSISTPCFRRWQKRRGRRQLSPVDRGPPEAARSRFEPQCAKRARRGIRTTRAHGSAEQNIALHKAVMAKVAENGGRVPDSMKN